MHLIKVEHRESLYWLINLITAGRERERGKRETKRGREKRERNRGKERETIFVHPDKKVWRFRG